MSELPPRAKVGRSRGRGEAAAHVELYALQGPLLAIGAVAAVLAFMFQGGLVAIAVLSLFALAGMLWRSDMVPILPACFAFQWLAASSCYIFYRNFGYPPGGGYSGGLATALIVSLLGLAALGFGIRAGLRIFRRSITSKTLGELHRYDISKLFYLTIIAFLASYLVNVVPARLWYGGAQIISNLLELRFVPYFLLLLAVFERRSSYRYAALATIWVVVPQMLTGFSDFKEILLVVIVAAIAQWKPWINSKEQRRQNTRILVVAAIGVLVAGAASVLWSGGVKNEWRQLLWNRNAQQASPIEKIGLFVGVVDHVLSNFNVKYGVESLTERSASSELYFSYVLIRVPDKLPHENGALLARAVQNAVTPRFLFPEKANLGGDSWLVRKYAGVNAAGDESGTSIGLGYMAEFYVDFGLAGLILLCALWGVSVAGALAVLARCSPSKEFFIAVSMGLCLAYLMPFEASFIKLLAGLVQRTIIVGLAIRMAGPALQRWLEVSSANPRPARVWRRAVSRP